MKKSAKFNAITEPVEMYVDGFGSILSDSGVDNAVGGAVISSDGSWRLCMTKFCKCHRHWYCKFGVHVGRECSNFCITEAEDMTFLVFFALEATGALMSCLFLFPM